MVCINTILVMYGIVTLCMVDVYGENSSKSDSDPPRQEAQRLKSSVSSGKFYICSYVGSYTYVVG